MTTAWFARAVCVFVFSCAVLSSLSSCKRPTDCHGFVDDPPTFLVVDRVGDEGVPYYDTRFVQLNTDRLATLPSCDGIDGLTVEAQVRLSNVGGGEGERCGIQRADADIGSTVVSYDLPDDASTSLLSADLSTSNPAVLTGSGSVMVGGCVGEWAAMLNASYTVEPTDDPAEGAQPPWTIVRIFRPGTGTGCAALVDCVDVFTARIVVGP